MANASQMALFATLFMPLVAGIWVLVFSRSDRAIRWSSILFSLVPLVLSAWMMLTYDRDAGELYGEISAPWIPILNSNFRIAVDDAQAGVHYLKVRGFNTSTKGAYELLVSFTPNRPAAPGGAVTLGDLDGDGDDDVLLRHAGHGKWLYYSMDGERGWPVRNFGATPNQAWALAGVGDVNGDGRDDMLLRHADTGRWLYYDLSGGRARLVWLGLMPNRDWVLAAIAPE